MHPWHTQVRAMHQIAVSNVSRILRSYDLVLLPYDLERDRTINKVCFAGIPSPTQHFFTWLCEQTSEHSGVGKIKQNMCSRCAPAAIFFWRNIDRLLLPSPLCSPTRRAHSKNVGEVNVPKSRVRKLYSLSKECVSFISCINKWLPFSFGKIVNPIGFIEE